MIALGGEQLCDYCGYRVGTNRGVKWDAVWCDDCEERRWNPGPYHAAEIDADDYERDERIGRVPARYAPMLEGWT